MANQQKQITILGATGTIGQNTLAVIDQHGDKFALHGLTAHRDAAGLARLAEKYKPQILALGDDGAETRQAWQAELARNKNLSTIPMGWGAGALDKVAASKVDMVVVGIVGMAALAPIWHGLRAGNSIALANKEAIVAAGHLLLPLYKKNIIPIDSEHNAIFQCLLGQDMAAVAKVILTASGGPFLQRDKKTFASITPAEAIAHPRWQMGKKISVDSATMFNKALEMIEAAYLFDLPPEKIDVVMHPESLVHSFVLFNDGGHLAQMALPDMKIPISFALGYPERLSLTGLQPAKNYWQATNSWHFLPPDEEKFYALALARRALQTAGTAPLILNSSNETLVEKFLAGMIPFTAIEKGVEAMLQTITLPLATSMEEVIDQDIMVKKQTMAWIKNLG